jgi:hypothetical protein
MNVAITDGLALMPPPFSAGLNNWSREDGLSGQGSWAGQANAAYVPADQDFAGCMEVQKTATTTKIRAFMETPVRPGVYLRVTARVKAVSGNLPSVRVAGWAGSASDTNVAGVVQVGPSVALATYGEVVTVTAIIGSGNRTGVDMVWGTVPVYGHFGIDLTGANGGVVRIDDITVEDVTSVFHRKLMDWVDVRDYGAIGNGAADDAAAFLAADADADGRGLLVPAGTYLLGSSVTLNAPVRFEGTVTMPAAAKLVCTRNYDLDTYAAAFGNEEEGFKRGLGALFGFTDHAVFDLGGRRVFLTAPVDVAAMAGIDTLAQRRVLAHGYVEAAASTAWNTATVTSVATYAPGNPYQLTAVANVANVPVGARVSGTGVGREVYVRSKNVGAGTVELSVPLYGGGGTRTYTFSRYRYMLDFSGFASLSRFEIVDFEFQGEGRASGVMLPPSGIANRFADCTFNKPLDRAITSIGTGCQGMFVDQCQFLSNEQPVPAQDRTSICLNVNANDAKIRDCRIVRFAHFAVLGGNGNMLIGNHFFQGDDQALGVRRAGVVFSTTNVKTLVTGNYVDNCFIEWTNEHDPTPDYASEFSFGGLTVNGNIFTVNDVSPGFRWLVMTPYGAGHFINGLTVNDNVFRTVNTNIDRIEGVDTTFATLDFTRMRNLVMEANAFNGVNQLTQSPVMVEHNQSTAADTWVVNAAAFLPFGGRARNVQSVVAEGAVTNASNAAQWSMPYVLVEQGSTGGEAHLKWQVPVKGRVQVTVRVDNPN